MRCYTSWIPDEDTFGSLITIMFYTKYSSVCLPKRTGNLAVKGRRDEGLAERRNPHLSLNLETGKDGLEGGGKSLIFAVLSPKIF